METTKLSAMVRDARGSASSRRMRRAGQLPANLTGLGQDPVALSVTEREFELLHKKGVRLVEMVVGDERVEALVRDIQWDTYGDKVLHVDFDRIQAGQLIDVEVSFDFYGQAEGALDGGVFQVLMDGVTVSCIPSAIPDGIEIDIRKLKIGEEVRIRDVKFPEGAVAVGVDPEDIVAIVSEREEEEPDAEDDEGEATPKLVGRDEGEGED